MRTAASARCSQVDGPSELGDKNATKSSPGQVTEASTERLLPTKKSYPHCEEEPYSRTTDRMGRNPLRHVNNMTALLQEEESDRLHALVIKHYRDHLGRNPDMTILM